MFFLVADERGLSELGGYMMTQKLTRPCVITTVDFNAQSAFKHREQEGIILGSRRSGANLWNLAIYSVPKEFRPSVTLIIASNIPLGR